MKKIHRILALAYLGITASTFAGSAVTDTKTVAPQEKSDETSLNLFSSEETYTFRSGFHDHRFGKQDSLYGDYSADRRIQVNGNWYLRLGGEYERFDFGGSDNGLPNHLQALYGHIAYEYIMHDHAGAGIELDPGVYFENRITTDAFDIPWKLFVTFPIVKDKIFGVVGVGGGLYQNPPIAPGGGIIWLFNDHLRLEGVFPKPALVYNPNDDWEFRLLGILSYDSFRTDDVNTPAWHLHNAVVEYSEVRAGVQAKYSGFKPFDIVAGAGYTIEREYDFFRADHTRTVKPSPYIQLAIKASF